jgi:alanine dehydrogenase
MIIGAPKEIKADEYRVAVLPVGAELLTKDGHTVLIEKGGGVWQRIRRPELRSGWCADSGKR